MKLFEHKPFDPRAVMGFGILNGTSIGLLNLSLGFNSVGFYQVTYSNLSSIFCDCNIILFYQWDHYAISFSLYANPILKYNIHALLVLVLQQISCSRYVKM
jgi:hypothetical protein